MLQQQKILNILYLLFCFIIIFYLYYLIVIKNDSWVLGDWLINYIDGGFKRRGLLGTLFIIISDLFFLRLDFLIFIIVSIFWICFLSILKKITSLTKISWQLFFLIISPVGLLFNISSTSSIGRKEILLFLFLSIWVMLSLKNKKNDIVFLLVYPILILIHEMFFFYFPYFLLFYLIKNNFIIRRDVVLSLLNVIVTILCIYFLGGKINEGKSYEIIGKFNIVNLDKGILNNDENERVFGFSYFYQYWKPHLEYLVVWLVYFIYIINYLQKSLTREKFKLIFIFLVFNQIFTIPLFYVATDWGRWINIHFILMIILTLYLKSTSNFNLNKRNENKYIIFGIVMSIFQIETCGLGFKLNYYIEIILSKII